MKNIIQVQASEEEREVIRKASEKLSLSVSSFVRMIAIQEAKKIIQLEVITQ